MFKVKATQHVLAVKDLEATENYFLDKLGFFLVVPVTSLHLSVLLGWMVTKVLKQVVFQGIDLPIKLEQQVISIMMGLKISLLAIGIQAIQRLVFVFLVKEHLFPL